MSVYLSDENGQLKKVAGNGAINSGSSSSVDNKTIKELENKIETNRQTLENNINDFKQIVEEDYATKQYVDENGGKIDSISVNGKSQTIDKFKNVDITIPAPKLIDISSLTIAQ